MALPAQKSVGWMKNLIDKFFKPAELIVDLFMVRLRLRRRVGNLGGTFVICDARLVQIALQKVSQAGRQLYGTGPEQEADIMGTG